VRRGSLIVALCAACYSKPDRPGEHAGDSGTDAVQKCTAFTKWTAPTKIDGFGLGNLYSPTFTPDGSQLLFVNDPGGSKTDIYIADLDGTSVKSARVLVTDPTYDVDYPSFSGKGDKLYFEYNGFKTRSLGVLKTGELVLDSQSELAPELDNLDPGDNVENPRFARDDLEVVFDDRATSLYRAVRAESGEPWGPATPINELNSANVDLGPVLSPDGLTIWFTRDYHRLFVATRAGRTDPFTAATEHTTLVDVDFAEPTISPDEKMMVFSNLGPTPQELWYMTRECM
jgi:hypothetical protein